MSPSDVQMSKISFLLFYTFIRCFYFQSGIYSTVHLVYLSCVLPKIEPTTFALGAIYICIGTAFVTVLKHLTADGHYLLIECSFGKISIALSYKIPMLDVVRERLCTGTKAGLQLAIHYCRYDNESLFIEFCMRVSIHVHV